VFSASILLATSTIASGLIGLARGRYIAKIFGAGPQTDAYMAAFRLPDLMSNFLVGGAISITLVTLLNRYRERGEEAEGEHVLFTVINLMVLVLSAASVVLMVLAAPFIRLTNPGFPPDQVELCVKMTRVLLPAQIFLFAGSALGSLLLVRRQFLYQAATPIIYNVSIIAFGMLLHRRYGVMSLAIGATVGFLVGSFGINAIGVASQRIRFRLGIDLHHPGLRSWFYMTLPLMFGFTLPFLDQYFAGYYASHGAGDITRLANAKQIFSAPMAMLAQAAGVAAMPFFAQLWASNKRYEFATGVADSVSRVIALGLLVASALITFSHPIVGLIYGVGRFTPEDVSLTAIFFTLYTVSLFAWSAQSIYARAFYATGTTWLPMLASVFVVCIAFPLYGLGYKSLGTGGLALASDVGILLQATVLAMLLHRRHMVSLASLDYKEMGRCLLAGLTSGFSVWIAVWGANTVLAQLPNQVLVHHARVYDLFILLIGSAVWLAITKEILEKTGSALPKMAMARLRLI
jgi:putative peptidoglycan lipid II flippase